MTEGSRASIAGRGGHDVAIRTDANSESPMVDVIGAQWPGGGAGRGHSDRFEYLSA